LTNIATITSDNGAALALTLGDVAATQGVNQVIFAEIGGNDTLAIDADAPTAVTVTFDSDVTNANSVIAAAAYAGAITVKAADSELDTRASTFTGGAGSDVLEITASSVAGGADQLGGVTNVETIKILGTTLNGGVTLADANATYASTTSFQTLTVDATALTTGVATIDAALEVDAKVILKGGGGADIITASASANLGDTIEGNGGADIITFASVQFTSADTVSGGDGSDVITFSDDATVADADYTNVTSVENLTGGGATEGITAVLGALASASGLTAVTFTDTGAASDSVTVGAGFTNNLTVNLDADAATNTVSAAAYTGVLTVAAADTELDTTASTITGGVGTSDEIRITSGNALPVMITTGVTNVEKITTVGTAGGISLTSADGLVASGKELAIDLTSQTTTANTINVSAETNGVVKITADSTGAHIITLGRGNDEYTHTGTTGVSTVVGTRGNNIIKTGGDADSITLGTGTDDVNSGAGNDTVLATGPTVAAGVTTAGNFTSADTINFGTGTTDTLEITTDGTTMVDTDFSGVTNADVLTTSAAARMTSVTLGANAMAAGFTSVTLADNAQVDTLVIGAGFTSALTVNLDTDTAANNVNASATAATITFVAGLNELDASANALRGGTGTGDTLTITAGGNAIQGADTVNYTGIENYTTVADAGNQSLTMSDGNVAAGKTATVNADSMLTSDFTFVASAETDGSYTVKLKGAGDHSVTLGQGNDTVSSHDVTTGNITVVATAGNNIIGTGEGADIITVGGGNDSITTGLGNDIIISASGQLDQNDTVNAGAGTNTLRFSNAATVRDSDFTNVSNVQSVTTAGAIFTSATLGANASTAGVTSVTFVDATNADTLIVGAGFASNLTVNVAGDANADTINAAAFTNVLTVAAGDDELDTADLALTGGTGGADEVQITSTNALTAIRTAGMSAIEKITAVGVAGGFSITTADALIASGGNMAFDLTAADDDTFTIDAALETNGTVTITADSTGAHIITLGAGADSYTHTAGGISTVVATAGANIISVGTAVDIITVGTGQDTLTLGQVTTADTVTLAAANVLVTDTVTITDWETTDIINIALAALNTGGTVREFVNARTAASAGDDVMFTITGATDLVGAAAEATVLRINTTVAYTASTLESALEFGGGVQLTADGAVATGDRFLVVYDDNANSYIGMATVNQVVPDDGFFAAGSIDIVQLVELTGVASVTSIAAVGDLVIT
jgi:hypothetical protein